MTRPLRALLLGLFTLLLLGQGVAAPAHCLRMLRPAGDSFSVLLCTPEGLQWHAPEDGTAPAPHAEAGFCPACPSPPQAALPPVPALSAPRWQFWPAPPLPRLAGAPATAPRGPPQGPRGPPLPLA
ncbi:hypothetical protein NON00_14155 [Roseomonas sp. GC11]|uniref:hypothetical protein n=1 Tax=Roseomonas sp. GC11 TaxID=2950546 RepID=UPI002108A2D5|nr:hypothetical protein [Roseomonas sp. GC11]MCQ4161064.1 hypothetical protein [Roseomonas sp. GC11]